MKPLLKPSNIMIGAQVGWKVGSQSVCGEVIARRSHEGLGQLLLVRLPEGNTVWMVADTTDVIDGQQFAVLKHGPNSISYGIEIAEHILMGKELTLPVNFQMTTLAATVLALRAMWEEPSCNPLSEGETPDACAGLSGSNGAGGS